MNVQIEELMGEALDRAVPHTWTTLDSSEVRSVMAELAQLVVKHCIDICDAEKLDYTINRKAAYDYEEKQIYAEGEAACDGIKYKIKHGLGVK